MAISLGDWSGPIRPANKRAVVLKISPTEEGVGAGFQDPTETPFKDSKFESVLGKLMPRDAALKDPSHQQFFEVLDCVLDTDDRIKPFVEQMRIHGE